MASTDPKTATQGQWEDLAGKVKAANREILYGTCSTAADTGTKVVTTTKGTFVLETGAMVRVKFTNANSYNGTATMAVDGTTTKNIVQKGTNATTRYWWDAGEVVDFVYDGTNFVIVDGSSATTTYYGVTKLADTDSSSSTSVALVPNSLYTIANNTICPYYSSSKTYALGDKVRYSKKLYKCTTAITHAEAWTAAHWTEIDPLQQQLDEAAFIGTDMSTAPTTPYVVTGSINDGAVTTAKIAADAVTADKIAANAVNTSELANSSVTVAKVNFASFPVAVPDYGNVIAFTGTTYTAPSDGFVRVRCDCTNKGNNGSCYMYVYVTRGGVEYSAFAGGNYFDDASYFHYYGDTGMIPVKAGDIIRPSLSGNSTSYSLRVFYPAIY